MDVILMERVPKLGQMGQVVSVRDGFARNFLIPRGKALRASKSALREFEDRRQELETRDIELKQDAQNAAATLDGKQVTVLRQASESGQLYGSVSPRDLVSAFADTGVSIDRSQVQLSEPIKTLGIHEFQLVLHPEVAVGASVNVARSLEEAEIQAGRVAPAPTGEEEDDEDDMMRSVEDELNELLR